MNTAYHSLHLMGTNITMTIISDNAEQQTQAVDKLLRMYEQRFSANSDTSELMQINQRAGIQPVVVNDELFELIEIGKRHSLPYESQLNIAIGPLVQLWRIGFSDAQLPTDTHIKAVLAQIQPEKIRLDAEKQSVFLKEKGMKIDLGALAKGYIADKVINYLKEQGAHAALINLGGNVLTFGDNPNQIDGYWRVGIQNPILPRGNHVSILKIKNQSVVTSGIYERQLTVNGKTYHHIFSSETGYPIESAMASITIVSELSCDGEIWTTRLFGKRITAALAEIALQPGIEALIIDHQQDVHQSLGMAQYIE
ncbi:FAD:protein FMN transferase [Tuanshanicoccus lijuaniae]|uniref:FAD:protein FMN transferase n=1 Tax=Aerococcaceae bacterium zg-1292 TaxID=2774330 RepID=UPI001BD86FCB|nr:FAD:protein FMN transferase [Aerococcaceae bacterium zg-BR22]MBS4455741.1 FAD:protein FMN transferase [Aerococcaceae bacterium zg-A91]MBS4457492.1 FAD:protein FMN transferase [Aerococcaceae bacterium zg-BR33]